MKRPSQNHYGRNSQRRLDGGVGQVMCATEVELGSCTWIMWHSLTLLLYRKWSNKKCPCKPTYKSLHCAAHGACNTHQSNKTQADFSTVHGAFPASVLFIFPTHCCPHSPSLVYAQLNPYQQSADKIHAHMKCMPFCFCTTVCRHHTTHNDKMVPPPRNRKRHRTEQHARPDAKLCEGRQYSAEYIDNRHNTALHIAYLL